MMGLDQYVELHRSEAVHGQEPLEDFSTAGGPSHTRFRSAGRRRSTLRNMGLGLIGAGLASFNAFLITLCIYSDGGATVP
jgi:hypothetical protein